MAEAAAKLGRIRARTRYTVMSGMQEEAAEKIDAGPRAALAKEGGRVYDEPAPSTTPRAAT